MLLLKDLVLAGLQSLGAFAVQLYVSMRERLAARTAAREHQARLFADAGDQLLEQNLPDAAWEQFARCLKLTSDPVNYLRAAYCLLQGVGRARAALKLFARANKLRRKQAKRLGVSKNPYRLLDGFWAGGIGHIAEIDYVVKLGILEGRKREDTIVYFPHYVKPPNRFLFEQWRPHVRVIEQASDLPFSEEVVSALSFEYKGPALPDARTVYYWTLAADTYRRWEAQKRKPLLTLPEDVRTRGWSVLGSQGIPDNAWFVALHVREAGSKPYQADLMAGLNSNVADFAPAISEITRRGGWVIRMGDPSMAALRPMQNVFDYCHSDVRSDWMDIFLASQCRFFLGTSSGPAYVPPAYGVDCVLTNWWPPAHRPWHPGDIFIPKLCRRAGGRRLTLNEMLREPVGYSYSSGYLAAKHKVVVEDSTPDDIRIAVIEMLDRLDGGRAAADDQALHDRVGRIFEANGASGMARMSTGFLKKYQNDLLK
jgi:putative glycosyltransferase (TIGR04372 family)